MQMLNFLLLGFQSAASFIMWIILLLFFAGLGLFVERFWYLFIKCDMGSAAFMKGISNYLKAGDYDRAIKYALTMKSPLQGAFSPFCRIAQKAPRLSEKRLTKSFLRRSENQAQCLPVEHACQPGNAHKGLTGTIYGTMECFDAIAECSCSAESPAAGIRYSITMSATLMGLLVCQPCILAHGVLSGKADKIIEDMDEKVTKLSNAVEE